MFERGSEWRRWDLHIHTPETAKNDQYKGATPKEKWNKFYETINDYVNTDDLVHNVVAIGITDYLSVDNYFKVIKDKRLPASIQLVIPNVEMRLSLSSHKSLVNIHFLFDPQIAQDLNLRFFSKLQFYSSFNRRTISAVKEDLIRLGRSLRPDLDDISALKEGIDQFNPSLDAVIKVFKEDMELRRHTLIGVVNSSNDGASGLNGSLEVARKSLYNFADFIFSSNPKDVAYFLGKKRDDADVIKKEYGSLKPCLHGSDAHSLEEMFRPDKDRFCWIKANPTFNGLKQIVYEPAQRVCISSSIPNGKDKYQIIDHIEFDNKDFVPQKLYFNSQLNCIIGGKSTGKSLLLHNIAKAVDEVQVDRKLEQTGLRKNMQIDGFRVIWADGSVDKVGENSNHKILYIPQTYLNRLSDEEQEKTEIDAIIEQVLLQTTSIKEAYEHLQLQVADVKKYYQGICLDLVNVKEQIDNVVAQIKEIGTSEEIQNVLKELKGKKRALNQHIELSEEQISEYEQTVQKRELVTRKSNELVLFKDKIERLHPYIEKEEFSHQIEDAIYGIETTDNIAQFTEALNKSVDEIIDISSKKWTATLKNLQISISKILQSNQDTQSILQARINKWNEVLEKNNSFLQISKEIAQKRDLFKSAKQLEQKLKALQSNYSSLRENLASSFDKFKNAHIEYECILEANPDMNQSELEFTVRTVFRNDAFCEKIATLFDKRTLKTNKDVIDLDAFDIKTFSQEKREELIDRCLEKTQLRTIKGITPETALREIFADWYNTTYNVTMENDHIADMSPGKKALVLLKLMISLTNSKFPILIDQPEDDLDNRSIFNELIPFILAKKQERQFIIATHNANVVLGGDTEEVIISNQHGASNPNTDNVRFQYLTGAIESDEPIDKKSKYILENRSIQEHICDILEGGKEAFALRQKKYHL